LYVDDTKLYRSITNESDETILQSDLNKISEWCQRWLLPINIEKTKCMKIGKKQTTRSYLLNEKQISETDGELDLGIITNNNMKYANHIQKISAKANSKLYLLEKAFGSLSKDNFLILYKSYIRPVVEFCSTIWSPYLKKDIEKLEKVQRRATKMVKGLINKSYSERLTYLGIPTLEERRTKIDLCELYKMINGKYNIETSQYIKYRNDETNCTMTIRGHNKKLQINRKRLEFAKNSFPNRVINRWNSLPESIVNSTSIYNFRKNIKNFPS
jgi:ribonucleases P/MRP protein subunit RPP40